MMMKSNKKKVVKNTVSLFFRMIVTMGVSLYTSRVVLDVLGVSDYGLYSVVGGVVALFSFISTSMATSTQRFLNFEKGTGDSERVSKLFGTSRFVHLLLALFLLVFIEVAGFWLLNNKLNINPSRIPAANWIFHLSVVSFVFTIINVPFRAAIIANEKMEAFALLSILEVLLKLVVALSIPIVDGDKLIWYGGLILGSTFLTNLAYSLYSRVNFPECKGKLNRDSRFLKSILSFSSWTLVSGLSIVLRNQGVSILLNIFFGTVINAAQGIANQINTTITGFAANFTQAVNPQIVKDYAAGKIVEMHRTIMFSSRISFILLFLIAFPIFIEADFILAFWLKEVPAYAVIFTRLVLVQALIESFSSVHATAQGATGKVKTYHLALSSIGLLNLPLSYLLLKQGLQPYSVFIVSIVVSSIISVMRLFFLRKSIGLSLRTYASDVLLRCVGLFLFSLPMPLILKKEMQDTFFNAIFICGLSILMILFFSFLIGMNKSERGLVLSRVRLKLKMK